MKPDYREDAVELTGRSSEKAGQRGCKAQEKNLALVRRKHCWSLKTGGEEL